jgi:FG-GAP-like repeat/ASPIC and UnbV
MIRRLGGWLLSGFLASGILFGGRSGAGEAQGPSPSTLEMAALLQDLAAKADPMALPILVDDRRADLLGRQLTAPHPTPERLRLRMMFAASLLQAGRIPDCLKAIDVLEEDALRSMPSGWAAHHNVVRLLRATAYMRLAEDENCHQSNTRDSCLLPIRGEGIHRKREGATHAVEVLEQILAEAPDDLDARWLLNVAHMTLGSYPTAVPKRFLIPPEVFASEHPLPRFDNVAKEAGVDVYGLAGGVVLDDFDHDGRLDLMVSHSGLQDQLRLFHNRGDGTFEDRTEAAGLMGEVGGLNLIQADYDNDGFVDVLVLRGGWMKAEGRFPLSLLRNNGDGTFTDVTKAAGLMTHRSPTQTATWFDYDGDGRLDLFVGNESTPAAQNAGKEDPYPCELFHNNGDGTFTNVAHEAGVDIVGYVKGVVSGDYNNDGRPDLYVSRYDGDNQLLRNDGPAPDGHGWRFTNVAAAAGVTEPRTSFGTFFFDYDNDGWPDLFVTGYGIFYEGMASSVAADYLGLPTTAERGRLYHNKGDGTFEDVTKAAGLYKVVPTMGLNFGDLDNDGWLDIYLGTGNPEFSSLIPNRMFRNDGGRRFQDVTTAGNFGHLQKGHGIAFGDIDNNGTQDVFEVMGGAYLADKAYSALYRNPGNANHWLSLELEGVQSNRCAIGARIKVVVDTKSGPRSIYRTVSSGGSFGASPLRQEIGLGDARRVTALEVFWPATGQTQKIGNIQLDRHYKIREGAGTATPISRPTFKLARDVKRSANS